MPTAEPINNRIIAPADFPVTWQSSGDEQQLWTQDRLHYPDPLTPLEFSLIEAAIDAGLTRAAHAYDIPVTLQDRYINGYLYIATVSTPLSAEQAARMVISSEAKLRTAIATLRATWENNWLPEIQRHLAYWERYDLHAADAHALLQHLEETIVRLKRLWEIHFLLFLPSMLAIHEFVDIYDELRDDLCKALPAGLAEEDSIGAAPLAAYTLLSGFHTKTVESSDLLWSLSRQILQWPSVHQLFLQHKPREILAKLPHVAEGEMFLLQLQEYLGIHGYRGDKLSLFAPYWIEDSTPVITMLQNYLRQPMHDYMTTRQAVAARREASEAILRAQLRDYPQPVREEVEFWLTGAQAGIYLKEEHGYWIDYKSSYHVRQVLLTIGAQLTTWGVVSEQMDLFYLTLAELRNLLQGMITGKAATPLANQSLADRRALVQRYATITPPPLLGTWPDTPPPVDPIARMFLKIEGGGPPAAETEARVGLLRGQAGSPGVARGPVKLVATLQEADKLAPGDVLVTIATAPPWSPLFPSIAAVVTDSGGVLSHCAVITREYGIPSVVGVGNATQQLRDGQWVEVDGVQGTVRILS